MKKKREAAAPKAAEAESRHTVEEMGAAIAINLAQGETAAAKRLQQAVQLRKQTGKPAPTPGSCAAEVNKLTRLLEKAAATVQETAKAHQEAETRLQSLAKELVEAERAQREMAEKDYREKICPIAAADGPAKLPVAKLILGGASSLDFDFGEMLVFGGPDTEISQDDEAELKARGDALKQNLMEAVRAAFGEAAQSVAEHRAAAAHMADSARKKRKLADVAAAAAGVDGSSAGSAAAPATAPPPAPGSMPTATDERVTDVPHCIKVMIDRAKAAAEAAREPGGRSSGDALAAGATPKTEH